jgi:ABC-2 type transport system ATP-binding protein
LSNETIVSVSNLKKHYGDVKAVDGISFEIKGGEIFSMLGPNGAGKTTTVEMMEGLRTPTSGDIEIFGVDVSRDYASIRHRVGVIPQEFEPFQRLKPPEAIEYFGGLFNRKMTREDVDSLLETVELVHRRKIIAMKLSGGEKRKLGLALALVGEPDLLFLDEPTVGLDAQSRRNLWGLLESLREAGRTILLTTHYLDEAEKLSDTVLVIHQGVEIAKAPPKKLIEQYGGSTKAIEDMGLTFKRIGNDIRFDLNAGESARQLVSRLNSGGVQFEDFTTIEPTLEDAFINLVGGTIVGGELTQ